MSFGYTYKEVKRMMLQAMLDVPTARDIVRKAGIIIGDEAVTDVTGSGVGPSLLLTIDPDGPTYIWDDTNNFTYLRYLTLVYDTGLGGFDADVEYPFSWVVPTTGLYRIDASVGVWRPTKDTWQMIEFWVTPFSPDVFGPGGEGGEGGALFMSGYDYSSSVLTEDDAIVLRGTVEELLIEGQRLAFNVEENVTHPDVPDNIIEMRPEPELTQLCIQLLGTPMEEEE